MNKDFFNYIENRGFINQCTDDEGLKKTLESKSVGYIGFDCTSDSLHAGSLLPLMLLRNFQRFGHKPIVLLGGGTTLIGDPSGKDETRKILAEDEIASNKDKLMKVFKKFISFNKSESNHAILIDNYEWLGGLKYISFLRDIGSKFSINKMLSLESIKQRLSREQNLSFLEFNYSILQAFDFLELNKKFNCKVQFGGSDQWGNIISGIDLVKKVQKNEVFGLTTPLITTSAGTKMGKTASGAIWLSEDKLHPSSFWQYWRNTSDSDVIKFLMLFTEIDTDEINKFKILKGSDLNDLKIKLANEITKLCHGEEKSKNAEAEAKKIVSKGIINNEIIENCENKIKLKIEKINSGLSLKKILIDLNLCRSNAESKRLISQGAVKINDRKVLDKEAVVSKEFLIQHPARNEDFYFVVYTGKNKFGVVELIT